MSDVIGADGVSLEMLPPFARFVFRGPAGAAQAMSEAFGISLPRDACRAAVAADRAALWLGPDEWLLLCPPWWIGERCRRNLRADRAAAAQPRRCLAPAGRAAAIGASGGDGAGGCNPLDLDPAVFPVGMCTRTVLAKAEIVLWRTAPESFHIEVWRSFAPYVREFLREHMREFGN